MRKLVFVLIVAFMLAPLAFAADKTVNFYGRAHLATFIEDRDKEYAGSVTDDSDLIWGDTGWVDFRFGANFTVNPSLTAKVEIRSNYTSGNMTRHWYGAWKFNDNGTFVVGHTWAPTFLAIDDSYISGCAADVQGSLRGKGLQLWYKIGAGTLKIAALTPTLTDPEGWGDTDASLPKLEMSYNHKFGPVDMNFFAGYNTSDAEENVASGTSAINVDSHLYGFTLAWEPKPAYLKAAVFFGQNLNEYGWGADIDNAIAVVSWLEAGTWRLADTDYFAYSLVGGFEVNDKLTFAAGWMHMDMEQDYTAAGVAIHTEEGADEYYVNATYKLADGVLMAPEISILDCQDHVSTTNGVDDHAANPALAVRGSRSRIGIYWMINF